MRRSTGAALLLAMLAAAIAAETAGEAAANAGGTGTTATAPTGTAKGDGSGNAGGAATGTAGTGKSAAGGGGKDAPTTKANEPVATSTAEPSSTKKAAGTNGAGSGGTTAGAAAGATGKAATSGNGTTDANSTTTTTTTTTNTATFAPSFWGATYFPGGPSWTVEVSNFNAEGGAVSLRVVPMSPSGASATDGPTTAVPPKSSVTGGVTGGTSGDASASAKAGIKAEPATTDGATGAGDGGSPASGGGSGGSISFVYLAPAKAVNASDPNAVLDAPAQTSPATGENMVATSTFSINLATGDISRKELDTAAPLLQPTKRTTLAVYIARLAQMRVVAHEIATGEGLCPGSSGAHPRAAPVVDYLDKMISAAAKFSMQGPTAIMHDFVPQSSGDGACVAAPAA